MAFQSVREIGFHERWRTVLEQAFVSDSIDYMASLLIRKLDDRTKSRLRVRAAHHGRSMEEEAREILRCALARTEPPQENLAEAIRRRFAKYGGVELPEIERDLPREPPDFS